MPSRGGPANNAGVLFQLWYTAYKISDLYFDSTIRVKPEVKYQIIQKIDQNGKVLDFAEIVNCDDLLIISNGVSTYYNIKYKAPNDKGYWTFSELTNQNVLSQFKKNFEKNPKGKLIFVSRDNSVLLDEIFRQVSSTEKIIEIDERLKSRNWLSQWEKAKEYFGYSNTRLRRLAKVVDVDFGITTRKLKKDIKARFQYHVNNPDLATDLLFDIACEAAIWQKTIDQEIVLNEFEKREIKAISLMEPRSIKKDLINSSSVLTSFKSCFLTTKQRRIARKETHQIVEWIDRKLDESESNILILEAGAGYGKSVVMKNVTEELKEKKIPFLGIKSDRYIKNSQEELRKELRLEDDISKLVLKLAKEEKVVLLVDQIDALSQSLSRDRQAITTYFNLIDSLSKNSNVRIVISSRSFDLKFDPLLIGLQDNNIIRIPELETEQVDSIISDFGLSTKDLPIKLTELIKVPLHLEIFCQIYSSRLNIHSIKTLQDLYEELWKQKVNCSPSNLYPDKLLKKIALKMNEWQTLSTPSVQFRNNEKELNYLLHEGLLLEEQKEIQFFHQTFFDYVFAISFISKNLSLYEHLKNSHQGLFIRSQVIQVINYLRDSNHPTYFDQMNVLLRDDTIRFHIKHLLLQYLAKLESPNDKELALFDSTIKNDKLLFENFLELMHSEGWLNYFINKKVLNKLIDSTEENLKNTITWKLRVLMERFPSTLLPFILDISSQKQHSSLVINSLLGLKDWSNPLGPKIYKSIKSEIEKTNFDTLSIFIYEEAVNCNPEWVLKTYSQYIVNKIRNFESNSKSEISQTIGYHDIELLKKLYEKLPNRTTKTIFEIICLLSDKTLWNDFQPYLLDKAYFMYHSRDKAIFYHYELMQLMEKYLPTLSMDKKEFLYFFESHLNTKQITILRLLCLCYMKNPALHKGIFFKLITKKSFLENYNLDGGFAFIVNKTLTKCYPFFTTKQKQLLNKIFLDFYPKWEREKNSLNFFGQTQYFLLNAIPPDEQKKYPKIKTRLLELRRKFPHYKDVQPAPIITSTVGAPLPEIAYEKMSLKQWELSFQVYDDSTDWGKANQHKMGYRDGRLTGGLVEHSRAFANCVEKEPLKFFNFILNLDSEVSWKYLAEGISGFSKSQKHLDKLKRLIITHAKSFSNIEYKQRICWSLEPLINNKIYDVGLIKLLEEFIYYDDSQEPAGLDPYHIGINTLKGSAVTHLMKIASDKEYFSRIINRLFDFAEISSVSFRSCMMRHLVYLIQHDKKKAFELFISLTKDHDPNVIKYGINSIRYLMDDYLTEFTPHIKAIVNSDIEQGYSNYHDYLAQVLLIARMKKLKCSGMLFEELVSKSDHAKAGAVNCAFRHLTYNDSYIRELSRKVFIRFLNNNSKEVRHQYSFGFNELEVDSFNEIYDVLITYSKAKIESRDSSNFYTYLKKCVVHEPKKCINLLQNFENLELPDIQHNAIGEKPFDILISAYNQIRNYSIKDPQLETAMNIFDKMLTMPAFKFYTNSVLDKIDNK